MQKSRLIFAGLRESLIPPSDIKILGEAQSVVDSVNRIILYVAFFIALYAFLWPYEMVLIFLTAHFGVFMPFVVFGYFLARYLPSQYGYLCYLLSGLGSYAGMSVASWMGGTFVPFYFGLASMLYTVGGALFPIFVRGIVLSTLFLVGTASVFYLTFLMDTDTNRLALSLHAGILTVSLSFFSLYRFLLGRSADTIAVQNKQLEEIRRSQMMLDIALSERNFGIVSFDRDGKICDVRGEPLTRIFPDNPNLHLYVNLETTVKLLQDRYKVINLDLSAPQEVIDDQNTFLIGLHRLGETTVLTYLDITKQRHMEKSLRTKQSLSVIGEITSGVAHNYNNSLAIALSNLESFPQEKHENLWNVCIFPAIQAIEKASSLSRKLLALSGQQRLNPEKHDISNVLRNMAPLIHSILTGSIVFVEDYKPELYAKIDRQEFETAIINLLLNSKNVLKNVHGRIMISARQNENTISVRVQDNGPGIPRAIREKVFDPFFTTNSSTHSAGLGLSMLKGFMFQSHGKVELYSDHSGTVVEMLFPRCKNMNEPVAGDHDFPQKENSHESHNMSHEVLIIDDNEQILRGISRLLETRNVKCHTASNAVAALDLLKKNPDIVLVLVDFSMPDIDGITLGAQIRSAYPYVRLCLITGEGTQEIIDKAKEVGFSDTLLKPVPFKQLMTVVEQKGDLAKESISI